MAARALLQSRIVVRSALAGLETPCAGRWGGIVATRARGHRLARNVASGTAKVVVSWEASVIARTVDVPIQQSPRPTVLSVLERALQAVRESTSFQLKAESVQENGRDLPRDVWASALAQVGATYTVTAQQAQTTLDALLQRMEQVSAAQARSDAEQARSDAEQARSAAEQARSYAEQARSDAEQARRYAEQMHTIGSLTARQQVRNAAAQVILVAGGFQDVRSSTSTRFKKAHRRRMPLKAVQLMHSLGTTAERLDQLLDSRNTTIYPSGQAAFDRLVKEAREAAAAVMTVQLQEELRLELSILDRYDELKELIVWR